MSEAGNLPPCRCAWPDISIGRPCLFRRNPQTRCRGAMADRFEYVGELDRAGKDAFLESLDVLCLPSVIRESKGLPCWRLGQRRAAVRADHGAFSEMVADTGGGLLYDPQRPQALAESLGRMLRDDAFAAECGRLAQQAVHERYTSERESREMLALYEGCAIAYLRTRHCKRARLQPWSIQRSVFQQRAQPLRGDANRFWNRPKRRRDPRAGNPGGKRLDLPGCRGWDCPQAAHSGGGRRFRISPASNALRLPHGLAAESCRARSASSTSRRKARTRPRHPLATRRPSRLVARKRSRPRRRNRRRQCRKRHTRGIWCSSSSDKKGVVGNGPRFQSPEAERTRGNSSCHVRAYVRARRPSRPPSRSRVQLDPRPLLVQQPPQGGRKIPSTKSSRLS